MWFMSIPTTTQVSCDAAIIENMLDRGYSPEDSRSIACSVVSSVGGPTPEQTTFVSIIIGLSSAIIGLYLSTGVKSKWQGDLLGKLEGSVEVNPGGDVPSQYPHHGHPQYPPNNRYQARPTYPPQYPPYHRPFNANEQDGTMAVHEEESEYTPVEWDITQSDLPDLQEHKYQG